MDTPKEIIQSGLIDRRRKSPEYQYHRINVQQLAKNPIFLDCLRAPKGYKFVQWDATSLEPTVLAELSGCPTYKEIYASGKPHDSYFYVACKLLDPTGELAQVYQIDNPTPESVKAAKKGYKKQRNIAKVFQLMSTFKAGAAAIHRKLILEDIDIDRATVESNKEKFWGPTLFGKVLEYEEDLLAQVQQHDGYYVNALGIPIVVTDKQERNIINTTTQSVGHGILDLWLWRLDPFASGREAQPVIPDYHDEGIYMVKEEKAAGFAKDMLEALQQVNDMLKWSIKIKGDPEITDDFTAFKGPDEVLWYKEKLDV